jgi:hypothetical protein
MSTQTACDCAVDAIKGFCFVDEAPALSYNFLSKMNLLNYFPNSKSSFQPSWESPLLQKGRSMFLESQNKRDSEQRNNWSTGFVGGNRFNNGFSNGFNRSNGFNGSNRVNFFDSNGRSR